jgi:hypothetical protein
VGSSLAASGHACYSKNDVDHYCKKGLDTMNINAPLVRIPSIPNTRMAINLMVGGALGLFIWEIWARVLTKAVLGYPLEPAGLIDALLQHNFQLAIPHLVREALHYAIGIIGYPVFYYIVSRGLRGWSFALDALVAITFSAGIAFYMVKGMASMVLGDCDGVHRYQIHQ